jgi:hypothetical protein
MPYSGTLLLCLPSPKRNIGFVQTVTSQRSFSLINNPRRKQQGVLSLPRTRESMMIDFRFRGNDDSSVGLLNSIENKLIMKTIDTYC